MGLDVHALLVVGLPTDQILKVETKRSAVKRFKEDTGEPYDKPVEEKFITILGREFPLDNEFFMEFALETIHPYLKCFYYDSDHCDDYDRDRVIGFEVKEMGGRYEERTRYLVTQTEIDNAKDEFKKRFGLEPQLFLTMNYSY
jgi:hypothetical protein